MSQKTYAPGCPPCPLPLDPCIFRPLIRFSLLTPYRHPLRRGERSLLDRLVAQ